MGEISACVFDAYGTLFDFEAATAPQRASIGDRAGRLSELWRAKQLQYTWLRTLQGEYQPFRAVTRDALRHAMAAAGIDDAALAETLLAAYDTLPAFPDAGPALESLRSRGLPLGILSNGDPDMLASAAAGAGLDGMFDAVLSAQAVGVFKTDARVYQLAVDHFGATPGEIAFASANCWDAHAAAHFGFRAFWINRAGLPDDVLPGDLAGTLGSLAELAARIT